MIFKSKDKRIHSHDLTVAKNLWQQNRLKKPNFIMQLNKTAIKAECRSHKIK